jgi:hypothetical protein
LLNAEVQLLKEINKGTRNYKIRANIFESSVAEFDIIGFVAEAKEFGELGLKDEEFSPISNLTIRYSDGIRTSGAIKMKLNVITRVDEYGGICEEIAKIANEHASSCICNHPGNS